MKAYGGVEEILHASSAEVSLADTVNGELQARAALSRSDPDAQLKITLTL
jgi:hypothetical protein